MEERGGAYLKGEGQGREGNKREGKEGGNSPWPTHFSEASATYVGQNDLVHDV